MDLCAHTLAFAAPSGSKLDKRESLNIKIKMPSKCVSCCYSTSCDSCENTNVSVEAALDAELTSEWLHLLLVQDEITGVYEINQSEAVKRQHTKH